MGKILNSEQNQEKVGENENMPKAKKKSLGKMEKIKKKLEFSNLKVNLDL